MHSVYLEGMRRILCWLALVHALAEQEVLKPHLRMSVMLCTNTGVYVNLPASTHSHSK